MNMIICKQYDRWSCQETEQIKWDSTQDNLPNECKETVHAVEKLKHGLNSFPWRH